MVMGLAAWAEQGRSTIGMLGDDALVLPIEHLTPSCSIISPTKSIGAAGTSNGVQICTATRCARLYRLACAPLS